jgi:hypothetical protein
MALRHDLESSENAWKVAAGIVMMIYIVVSVYAETDWVDRSSQV